MTTEAAMDNNLVAILTEYKELGGVIDFKFFRNSEASTDKHVHLSAARHTPLALADDNHTWLDQMAKIHGTDPDTYFNLTVGDLSENARNQISIDEFFGPFFEIKTERPILCQKKGKTLQDFEDVVTFSDYYYYDDIEESNIVQINRSKRKKDFVIEGYTETFLQPPHGFGGKRTNL